MKIEFSEAAFEKIELNNAKTIEIMIKMLKICYINIILSLHQLSKSAIRVCE